MLEQRRNFGRHEQMNFGGRKMFAERAQRGRHQDSVAKVFKLQRKNFHSVLTTMAPTHQENIFDILGGLVVAIHEANCSS